MFKYIQKKIKNQELIKYIVRHVSTTTMERLKVCGDFMTMVADVTLEKKKVHKGSFCEHRFCPMCAWRLAKKEALKISILMRYLKQEQQKEFIFLTLTAPNVTAEKINSEIDKFNKAFKKLVARKEVTPVVKGYIRKLEITYDSDKTITEEMYRARKKYYERRELKIGSDNPNYDKYHTHFHVVIAVNKSYFTGRDYLKQEKWLDLWRQVMNDETITQVDVRRITENAGKEINEIAKYSAKDADYLISAEVFDTFYKALKGRQVITYNGLFSEANKLYKLKELERFKELDPTEYVYMLLYTWGNGNYVEAERRELSESERKKINRQLLDEADEVD